MVGGSIQFGFFFIPTTLTEGFDEDAPVVVCAAATVSAFAFAIEFSRCD